MLWNDISGILKDIMNTGFVRKLADGTLDENIFAEYLGQDMLYLKQDNEALFTLAKRAPVKKYGNFFIKLAMEGVASEEEMQKELMPLYNVRVPAKQSLAFRKYGKFLLDNAYRADFEVAVSALLPCFWVYGYAGNEIFVKSAPHNKYMKFISAYASVNFNLLIEEYIKLTEEISGRSSLSMQEKMRKVFQKAAKYELMVFSAQV
jgi:thiaminase/transcriptional activator TenA